MTNITILDGEIRILMFYSVLSQSYSNTGEFM